MGRKNSKARERMTVEDTERMFKRIQQEERVFKAHKAKPEFYKVGSLVDSKHLSRSKWVD